MPVNVAPDRVYMTEWLRRMHVVGMPGPSTLEARRPNSQECRAGAFHKSKGCASDDVPRTEGKNPTELSSYANEMRAGQDPANVISTEPNRS